jgi:hypothetical protein
MMLKCHERQRHSLAASREKKAPPVKGGAEFKAGSRS